MPWGPQVSPGKSQNSDGGQGGWPTPHSLPLLPPVPVVVVVLVVAELVVVELYVVVGLDVVGLDVLELVVVMVTVVTCDQQIPRFAQTRCR